MCGSVHEMRALMLLLVACRPTPTGDEKADAYADPDLSDTGSTADSAGDTAVDTDDSAGDTGEAAPCFPRWSEDFETYAPGSPIVGLGDWSCFGESCIAQVSEDGASSGTRSLDIPSNESAGPGVALDALSSCSFDLSLTISEAGTGGDNLMVMFDQADGSRVALGYNNKCGTESYATLEDDACVTLGARAAGQHEVTAHIDYDATSTLCIDGACAEHAVASISAIWFHADWVEDVYADAMEIVAR